jgi:hypothetical protein
MMMMIMMTLKVLKFYSDIWKKKLNVHFKRKQMDCEFYVVCDERYFIVVCLGIL